VNRAELEHVIRAAASISGDREIVIVGSQAVLGQFPSAPDELLVSADADLYPREHPERAELIEGSIGELSPFHETFGYYAHGVGERTAVLPEGWQARLVPVPSGDALGLCLEVHDLVLSKYAAGREKDRDYVRSAIRHGLVDLPTLLTRVGTLPLPPERVEVLRAFLVADFAAR